MSIHPSHDPVTAIAESEATGEAAEIFADIRQTMEIPLITSVWRALADDEAGLRAVWNAAKPLYLSGVPAAALVHLCGSVAWPVPCSLHEKELTAASVPLDALPTILAIVCAYNRSNALNLIALSALLVPPSRERAAAPRPAALPPWPPLPRLLERAEIDAGTWALLQQIRFLGALEQDPPLATLWRHLAYWPGLLTLIKAAFVPLQRDGTLRRAAQEVLVQARAHAARIAYLRPSDLSLPEDARELIRQYLGEPSIVARMVTLGHALAQWLGDVNLRAGSRH